jgi:hypothetical protein
MPPAASSSFWPVQRLSSGPRGLATTTTLWQDAGLWSKVTQRRGMQRVASERLLVTRRMIFVLVAVVGLVGVLLVGVQGQAQAIAPRPPHATLKQDIRILQDGLLISYCWGPKCVDGFSRYPSAALVRPDTQLYIRLSENRRPKQFSLSTSQTPDGRSRRIDTTLRRVVRDGKTVAWDAYFRLERPEHQYYMGAFGIWQGAGGKHGDAYWAFHAKTGP